MKFVNVFLKTLSVVLIIATAGVTQSSAATRDTIKFVNYNFNPSSLNVAVGDTIVWTGNFTQHIIQNIDGGIPQNAPTFGPTTSSTTSLSYVVTVAGTYNYKCNIHSSMIGSFTAAAADVKPVSTTGFSLEQNYPNPSNGATTIKYTLLHPSEVHLTLSDINGKKIKELVNQYQGAGSYEVSLDGNTLADGAYIYQLQAGDAVLTRQMVVVKK